MYFIVFKRLFLTFYSLKPITMIIYKNNADFSKQIPQKIMKIQIVILIVVSECKRCT